MTDTHMGGPICFKCKYDGETEFMLIDGHWICRECMGDDYEPPETGDAWTGGFAENH